MSGGGTFLGGSVGALQREPQAGAVRRVIRVLLAHVVAHVLAHVLALGLVLGGLAAGVRAATPSPDRLTSILCVADHAASADAGARGQRPEGPSSGHSDLCLEQCLRGAAATSPPLAPQVPVPVYHLAPGSLPAQHMALAGLPRHGMPPPGRGPPRS